MKIGENYINFLSCQWPSTRSSDRPTWFYFTMADNFDGYILFIRYKYSNTLSAVGLVMEFIEFMELPESKFIFQNAFKRSKCK